MHFPANASLIFFDWRIDQWQVFGWYWSNFENCSLQLKFKPIWSPSQRGRWATHPLLGFYYKNCAISRKTFYINLSASCCGWSHIGHWLLKKIQSHCFSRNQPNTVCLFSSSPARQFFAFSGLVCSPFLFSLAPVPAPVLIPPPTATTSSQPSAVAAYLVQNPKVKLSSFSFRENKSLLDSPPS